MLFIYMIQNIIDNKVYIGQTTHLPRRWSKHKSLAKNYLKYSLANPQKITIIMNEQGIENFECILIETHVNSAAADKAETFYIKQFKANDPNYGYNKNLGGPGFGGIIPTDAQTDTMSEVQKQRSIKNGGSPSVYKGVYFDKTHEVWVARINRKFVGLYKTEEAAYQGRCSKLQG